jgi:hypothetical protein
MKKYLQPDKDITFCRVDKKGSGQLDIFLGSGTIGPKRGAQETGCKKTRFIVIQKEKRPLLFLNNNEPVFCTLLFAPHMLDPIFFKVSNRSMCSKRE